MNELLQSQIVKWVSGALLSLLAGTATCASVGGCALKGGNAGEIGVRTSWAVYHEAKKGKEDVKASLEIEVPALIDWVTGENEPAEVVAP